MARVVRYIVADDLRGRGTTEDLLVRVIQLWTLDGVLVAEYNPNTGESYFTGQVGK